MQLKRLPDTELEVLQALWQAGEPQSRAWIEARLAHRGWATNTFNTYLTRLTEKGYLSCEKRGKTNYYTPQISQDAYLDFESRSMLSRLFGGSAKRFMASLARGGSLKQGDVEELRRYLDSLREEDGP